MYILAINGSPRGRRSNTDRILQPFLEGARAAGAETETVYLADLKINPCLGCFTCWTKTPGVCVQPFLLGALIWGYRQLFARPTWMEAGTPLYFALAGLATLLGSRFFTDYGDVLGYLVLAGIWLGTLAAERPFTAEYFKWSYPPALWNLPVFLRTNAVITTAWGWVYLLMAVLALAGHARPEQALLWTVMRNLLLLPSFAFTAWFQKWYPARG